MWKGRPLTRNCSKSVAKKNKTHSKPNRKRRKRSSAVKIDVSKGRQSSKRNRKRNWGKRRNERRRNADAVDLHRILLLPPPLLLLHLLHHRLLPHRVLLPVVAVKVEAVRALLSRAAVGDAAAVALLRTVPPPRRHLLTAVDRAVHEETAAVRNAVGHHRSKLWHGLAVARLPCRKSPSGSRVVAIAHTARVRWRKRMCDVKVDRCRLDDIPCVGVLVTDHLLRDPNTVTVTVDQFRIDTVDPFREVAADLPRAIKAPIHLEG